MLRSISFVLGFLVIMGPVRAGEPDEGDVLVGRSAAAQLKIGGADGFIPQDNIVLLEESAAPFTGWVGIEPGFDHIVVDEPGLDFFTLQTGCQVRLELVQADPALAALTSTFSVIDDPGERALLGGATLHAHLTWWINSDHAAFNPLKTLWRATFKLVDTGTTLYAQSTPFTFYFANVDCVRGDCNADSVIDARDIQPFVMTVLDPMSATAESRCSTDTNRDGLATPDDVASFVEMLLAP